MVKSLRRNDQRCGLVVRCPSDAHPSIDPGLGPEVVGQDANQGTPFMWLATHEPHLVNVRTDKRPYVTRMVADLRGAAT